MLRHLVGSLQRTLTYHTSNEIQQHLAASVVVINQRRLQQRTLSEQKHIKSKERNTIANEDDDLNLDSDVALSGATEIDTDYVQPYRTEHENRMSTNAFVEALRTRFRLTTSDVDHILSNDVVKRAYKERSLVRTLDELCTLGVTKRSFLDSPWLITLEQKRVEQKIALLRSMPIRDINHFIPFMCLTVSRLTKLVTALNRERETVPFGNRIYYIADKLKVDPYAISMYLSKRLFILEMPFVMLEENLQIMINYNVSSQDILRDLWAFRYMPKSIINRLERAKRAKKDKIMPWMVRCPESILQRSLQLTLDELAVLGDKQSSVEYVADRLGFDIEHTKAIMARHPQVFTVRVTKIKEILDYLLDEAGFTKHEVANVIRILCHSLETTKQRIDELKSIGCRPSTLVIVCRSKREYDKFVNSWMATHNDVRSASSI